MTTSAPSNPAEPAASEYDDDGLPSLENEELRPYFVIRQEAELDFNFREKRIQGKSIITLASVRGSSMEEIAIDARQSEIDVQNMTIEVLKEAKPVGAPRPIPATYNDPYKLLDVPPQYNWNATHHDVQRIRMRPLVRPRRNETAAEDRELVGSAPVDGSIRLNLKDLDRLGADPTSAGPKRPGIKLRLSSSAQGAFPTEPDLNPFVAREYRITIPFTTKHVRDGLQFVGVDPGDLKWPHVYTRHSVEPGTASCIFPCIDDHGQSCSWGISLKFPKTLGDALRQPLATQNGIGGHGHASGHHKAQNSLQDPDYEYGLSEEDKLLEMTALCSGYLVEEITDPTDERKKIMLFELDKKVSVQKIGFAIGPFEQVDISAAFRPEADDEKLGANALKIPAYCLPGRADEVVNTCQTLPSAADFFTFTFARYPFEEYRVCFLEDMVEDTVTLHSLSFVTTRLLYPENVIDPEDEIEVSRKLVNSLATQWSGINLLPSKRQDLWVVIGIAYYMTDLYLKKLCGNNDYRFRTKTMSDKLVELDVDRPSLHELGRHLHVGDFEMDFMILKAPLVMFILDKRLMKAPAQTNLTRIISRILYKANIGERQADWLINTESFRRHCEKNAKSKLETFWKQWVYGSGCPRFDVSQKFNKKKLCVEMNLKQVQAKDASKKQSIDKQEFLRRISEKRNDVLGGPMQVWFTGPMTIRIHEADGTPYEHIVEVKEDGAGMRTCKYDIPYNTKYKRLKRSRRQRDKAVAQTNAEGASNEESLLYCLGDVLQSQDDIQEWDLRDWSPEMERKMDQESYEWIRMDADFEWICTMKTNSESYMYVSQLQQDRDVVAQQDTILFLSRVVNHPLVSSILTRTLFDRRYFHGIRTMACGQLCQHNIPGFKNPILGLSHLMRTFSELFCFPGTHMPRPNDFSDRKQYLVQSAIPQAIAKTRDKNGKCPELGRRFLLDQIKYNNNANNPFSDNFYVAKLLGALATSLIPEKPQESEVMLNEQQRTQEDEDFLQDALTEIDRYRRMDEWANSYQNIWTTTALDCKQRLMKAGVIPRDGLDFVQYLQDETYDLVRIKAFEALVDLGFMMDEIIFTHLLQTLSTDKSPYVRRRLLKVFSLGLAGLAIGEFSKAKDKPVKTQDPDGMLFGDVEEQKDDMLVVEAGDKDVQERHVEIARKHDLDVALAALKTEVKEQFLHQGLAMQKAVWAAMNSKVLGRAEKSTLNDFCALMFDAADEWILTLQLPKYWKVAPPQRVANRLMVTFTPFYRGEPVRPKDQPASEPEPVAVTVPKAPEPKRVIFNPKIKASKPLAAPARQPSVSATAAAPIATAAAPSASISDADSIVAQAPPKPTVPLQQSAATSRSETTPGKTQQKRPRDKIDGGSGPSPVAKRPKINGAKAVAGGANGESPARKIVTLKHPNLRRILGESGSTSKAASSPRQAVRSALSPQQGDTAHATAPLPRKASSPLSVRASPASPVSRADGGGGSIQTKPARKPLPGGPSSGSTSPAPSPAAKPSIVAGHKPLPTAKPKTSPAPGAPGPTTLAHSTPSQASPPPGAGADGQPASKRTKIVIKKRPSLPPQQSPPPGPSGGF